MKLSLTHHAIKRAHQRVSWNRRATSRMLERVFYNGLAPGECPRRLRSYLETKIRERNDSLVRIYGEHLYIFARPEQDEAALMTLYVLPQEMRPLAKRALKELHALAA